MYKDMFSVFLSIPHTYTHSIHIFVTNMKILGEHCEHFVGCLWHKVCECNHYMFLIVIIFQYSCAELFCSCHILLNTQAINAHVYVCLSV